MIHNQIKPLALYYPQFHEFEENNRFWGKGFTEWNNLNSWTPFFKGHQIRKPLWGQYNLIDRNIRKKQAEYARQMGLYGFVYYHYWFSHARQNKVMYEVLERILKDGEPNMPFAFMWANEPWTKRWDGLEHEYLIKQEYGDENLWIKHIRYLIKFFKHKNYIKIDNKPIFYIYRCRHIGDKFSPMIKIFERELKKNGFSGLYLIQSLTHFEPEYLNSDHIMATQEFNPNYYNHIFSKDKKLAGKIHITGNNKYFLHDFNLKVKSIKNIPWQTHNKEHYTCFCTGWDASPRAKGRIAGIETVPNISTMEESLTALVEKTMLSGNKNKFLLNFAWNEWGEGAVMEPDTILGNKIYKMYKKIFNPMFKEDIYLDKNKDVEEAVRKNKFKSGYHHYILYGKNEGRNIC